MASPELVAIGRRLIANTLANTTDIADTTYVGDGRVFTDPDRFERERIALFRDTPQVLCWGGDLGATGDVVARVVAGVPVLATRDEDGGLHAFLNACSHRGMQICDGLANTRRLACDYHVWTYSLDGTLVGLPNRDRFPGLDTATLGLQPLPIEEQAGLIVVGLHEGVDLAGFLDPIADAYAPLGYDRYRSGCARIFTKQANWKLMIDLNNEAYHVQGLHRESLTPILADHCAVDTFGPHTRMAVPFLGIEAMADVPDDEWPERPNMLIVTTIFPSTVLVDHPGNGGSLHRIGPGRHVGESTLHLIEGLQGEMDEAAVAICEDVMAMNLKILNDEDYPATEACQRGYDAGSRSLIGGAGEPLIGFLHDRWDEAIGL